MAHTFDNGAQFPTSATATDTTNPLVTTFTCNTGATVFVVMLIYAGASDRTGGAPTYNTVLMTQADSVRRGATSPECTAELWYLLNPPTGTFNISVPNSAGLAMKMYLGSGKAQAGFTSAFDVANGAGTTATNPTASVVTTVNGDIIFAVVASGAQTWNSTAVSGVEIAEGDLGTWGGGSQYLLQGTLGTQAMTFTFGTSEDYGLVVAAFKEIVIPLPAVGFNNYLFVNVGDGMGTSERIR